jgi:hypothetical protein
MAQKSEPDFIAAREDAVNAGNGERLWITFSRLARMQPWEAAGAVEHNYKYM